MLQTMLCQHLGPTHLGPICLVFPHQPLGLHIVPTSYSLHGQNASNISVIVNITSPLSIEYYRFS